jgi:hypothetical protein
MELENILSEVSQLYKGKVTCFVLYFENRSNRNTSIIIPTYKYIQIIFPKVVLLKETKGEGRKK